MESRASDKAALAVIKAYRSMPEHLKEAVRCVYDEVRFLGVATTIESLKDALIDLKEMCGERWFTMYKETLKDIKKIVPEILKGQSVEELG